MQDQLKRTSSEIEELRKENKKQRKEFEKARDANERMRNDMEQKLRTSDFNLLNQEHLNKNLRDKMNTSQNTIEEYKVRTSYEQHVLITFCCINVLPRSLLMHSHLRITVQTS